ncbi:MAG: alpha/beta hydrolase, partial [Photobacterium halotolerans]
GSNAVVRDIDRLREVLGDSQLTFLGYSYGSRLGALYAHTFPDKVRAIVLDSPLSPVAANNVEIRVGNTAGYDKTLSHRLSFDASPERRDRLQTIIHLAEDRGYYYAADIDLGRAYLSDAMYAAVARESWGEWDYIQDAMTILLDHDSAEGILSGLDQIWQNQDNSITPEDFRALAHFRAVVCTDERLPLAENELQSALFRYEAGSSLYGKFVYEKTASLCSGWTAARDPIADMSDLEARLNGKQILVIGGRLDPATPYAWTEEMVSSLGASASLLTMENYVEHGFSYNGFDCIDQATTAYLLDPSQKVSDRVCQPYSWYSFGFDRVFPVPHPTRNIIGW